MTRETAMCRWSRSATQPASVAEKLKYRCGLVAKVAHFPPVVQSKCQEHPRPSSQHHGLTPTAIVALLPLPLPRAGSTLRLQPVRLHASGYHSFHKEVRAEAAEERSKSMRPLMALLPISTSYMTGLFLG